MFFKKEFIVSFLIAYFSLLHGYAITNLPESIPITVAVTKSSKVTPFDTQDKAVHILDIGEKGAWNQKELREKWKKEEVMFWAYAPQDDLKKESIDGRKLVVKGTIPVNANLKIIIVKENGLYKGGAFDAATGKYYTSKREYDDARDYAKKLKDFKEESTKMVGEAGKKEANEKIKKANKEVIARSTQ